MSPFKLYLILTYFKIWYIICLRKVVDIMRKVEQRLWKKSVLDKATLITEGKGFMRTYDLSNGQILKQVKSPDEVSSMYQYGVHSRFVSELSDKLELSKLMDNPDLVLPSVVYINEYGNIEAYSVPKVEHESLEAVLPRVKSLEVYEKIFSLLTSSVARLNNDGIMLPDLANTSNVLISPRLERLSFIDYDGMQVKGTNGFFISKLLEQENNPMLTSKKYMRNGLFNKNIDKLSLLVLFIYYTTGKNIMNDSTSHAQLMQVLNTCLRPGDQIIPDKSMFDELFVNIGIEETELSELVQRVFDPSINNLYPHNAIKTLTKTHNLVVGCNGNRMFKRK